MVSSPHDCSKSKCRFLYSTIPILRIVQSVLHFGDPLKMMTYHVTSLPRGNKAITTYSLLTLYSRQTCSIELQLFWEEFSYAAVNAQRLPVFVHKHPLLQDIHSKTFIHLSELE